MKELLWRGGETPFAEIKAEILSALKRGEDVSVRVSGKHEGCEPLVFGEEFGGYSSSVRFFCTEDCELRFARPLKAACRGGLYYARTDGRAFMQGGRAFVPARYPAEGYLRVARTDERDPFSAFYYAEGDLPNGLEADGLYITIWPGGPGGRENWHTMTVPVREIDRAARRIVLGKPSCLLELGTGTRYFLLNHPSFLRGEGEYCIREGEAVFLPFPAEDPVLACPHSSLIELNGRGEAPISNFSFENFRLRGAAGEDFVAGEFGQYRGAVKVTGTKNFRFVNGSITDCAGHAVCLYGDNEGGTVSGCDIARIGHTGIYAVGHDVRDFVSRGHFFRNNHIRDVGLYVGHGSGIQLLECSDTRIENNRIHHSPRYAISVLGFVSAEQIDGVLRSADSRRREDCSRAHDVVIARNDVFRCNLDSQDTGIIQAYYAGPNVRIEENYIHDSDIPFSFGNGIYLDDCCKKFVVAGNFVSRMQLGGGGKLNNLVTAKGTDHVIARNIFADNGVDPDGGVFSVMNLGNDSTLHLTCMSNAVIRSGENLYVFANWAEGRISFSDFQLVEAARVRVLGGYGRAEAVPAEMWSRRDGFDAFTQCSDARFDAQTGCFAPDSPARAFGIPDFDMHRAGLTGEYAGERGEIERVYLLCEGKYAACFEAHTGEELHFECYGADENNVPVPVEADLETDGLLEEVRRGVYRAVRKGKTAVRCAFNGFSVSYPVYIDDAPASVSVRLSAAEVSPHGEVRVFVRVKSEEGRELSPALSSVAVKGGRELPAPFGISVAAGAIGSVEIEARAGEARARAKIPVRRRILGGAECRAVLPVMREGERSGCILRCLDRRGKLLKKGKIALSSDRSVRAEGDTLAALSAGEASLQVRASFRGTEFGDTVSVRVVPASYREIPCRNVGCFGRAFTEEGKLHLFSDGANIWFREDSFSAVGGEGREIGVTVERIVPSHPDSQAGVLLRGGWGAGAPCINLRTDAAGGIMVCMRAGEREEIGYAFGMHAALPVRLRLVREGGKVAAFVNGGNVWSAPDPFTGETVAGASLFAVNRTRCAEAVFQAEEP